MAILNGPILLRKSAGYRLDHSLLHSDGPCAILLYGVLHNLPSKTLMKYCFTFPGQTEVMFKGKIIYKAYTFGNTLQKIHCFLAFVDLVTELISTDKQ